MSEEQAANSLKRGLAILEVFSEDRLEWTPEELMEKLGYSRPTLYRYLKTLREAGLLSSNPNAGFTLGPKVVEMDFLLRKSDALILNGQKHLKNLTDRYTCTALLVRRYGDRILCVASERSAVNPRSSYPRGRPMPLGRGAIARSLMAFLPRRHLIPMIEHSIEDLSAIGLGNTVEEICDSLKRVKRAGYAVAYGEVTPGVVGIAAPVFDAGRSPIASVCVTIAGHLVNGNAIDEISGHVRQAAAEITQALSEQRHNIAAQ
ncbi:IclR family transcriptional regulator [Chelativorans sp. AA-79]|uniref:IclR family transcriptional regulator n=1 Tax=Chelativorans sp. AA-79 TaxID=3028735 RepID=UPI0023F7BA57|nr:IclR family transcriptional regulator [Chelativorans sp. AA-79]WEX10975.1 IclR family transcriptional regulator [Chelativorans sp. AA-79]